MISKNLYFNIVFRVLLILLFSLLLGYFVFVHHSLRLSLICILILVLVTINLVHFLNTTNRKIRFFFDSVKNDDSSLSFSSDTKDKSFDQLYESMNRVNTLIQKLKIENRNQEQYFQILLEHLAVGIITYNEKGFILHANSTAKSILSAEVLTHLSQIERIDEKLYREINGIKPFDRRLIAINTENGELQLSLKATSFTSKGTEMVILSLQDIKHELDEKELESWMKLIRVLMHEIMNSITPITSLSESLSNLYTTGDSPLKPEQISGKTIATTLQGLNVIKEQGKGLMSFVDSYRKLTRVPEPERKQFKVADLMNRVQVLYNSIEEKGTIKLSFSVEDPELEIFADQNMISQVLINLVRNAIEANESNTVGQILLLAGIDSSRRPEICVIDNGPGIPEDNLDKIFVPFFTTRQNGSGIGLSISRQIMRAHGGNLKVRSVPGKETVFCLSF